MPARPPESAHAIALAGQQIGYRLRRSSRRSIGLIIDHRGLRVGAPLRASLGDIERLIQQHAHWVLDKLAAWQQRTAPEGMPICDGSRLSILGAPRHIRIEAGHRAGWQFTDDEVRLCLPAAVDAGKVLETALREHARALFLERLALYAPRLGVPTPSLRLSSARTRWGSCSARGKIALNWRLIFMPLPVVDYVVCHELAHLREMNHSPRFWSVVATLCPDWAERRLELRRLGRQIPIF